MKSKIHCDPELGKNARRWYWPIRSIGQLMIVVALIGLTLWGMRMMPQRAGSGSLTFLVDPSTMTMVQGPLVDPLTMTMVQGPEQIPSAPFAPPRDRFVIVPRPEIDPHMFILARPDLDAGMVIHLGTRGRLARVAPMVGEGPPVPGPAPLPVPGWEGPHDGSAYPP
jgi:hypothetical protein